MLAVVDLGLAVLVFRFPGAFTRFFYGIPTYRDTSGLLSRTGGFWLTFGIIQLLAFWIWSEWVAFLALVAGVRFSESVADWVYLVNDDLFTPAGGFGFFLSVPYTLGFGVLLLHNSMVRSPFHGPSVWQSSGELLLSANVVMVLLVGLFCWDFITGILQLRQPEKWFTFLHGGNTDDSLKLLIRTAGVRLSFALTQGVALVFFWYEPVWLIVVAGLRLSEGIADWFCGLKATKFSTVGRLYVIFVPIINLFVGVTLIATYKSLL